jgi:putative phosphoribosyl transferase
MKTVEADIRIPFADFELEGELIVPDRAKGVVLFAHGSGSSRHSKRNQFVARSLREAGVGTLLFDLLTAEEEYEERNTRHLRFDIGMLADRLLAAADWLNGREPDLRIGFFGASTGGGAALVAAARSSIPIAAVVSRGGRPDLAGPFLSKVKSPTLLIVGGDDGVVIDLNEEAFAQLRCEKELKIIPGASHLFEEPGTLEAVADLAGEWFVRHME